MHEPGVLVVGAVAALDPERGRAASADTFEAERRQQDSLMERVREVIEPYARTGAIRIADGHKAGPVRNWLERQGMVVELTTPNETATKQRSVTLRARLEDGSLRCWEGPAGVLVADLRAVRSTDAERIHLPRRAGGHCDAAVALAAGVWGPSGTRRVRRREKSARAADRL